MMKKLGVFLVLVMCLGLTSCCYPVQGAEIDWVHSMTEGLQTAKSENKPVMVDFYTDWCGWCTKLDKDTYSDPDVVKLAESFVCVKVDGDKDSASAAKYGVRGYPTIVFLNSAGKEIDRNVGYVDAAGMAQKLKSILGE